MVTLTGNFNRSCKVKFNAVLDVKFSDVNVATGGGAQILNATAQGPTYQNDLLEGAVIYLLFLDGIQYVQIDEDASFSNPLQKEFKLDPLTGVITFSFNMDDPVLETIFYSSQGTTGIPPAEPVTVAEFKNYAKIDTGSLDDTIIADLITTAREQCEDYSGLSIINRTVTAILNNSCGGIFLPYCPYIAMISARDSDGNIIDPANYTISGLLFPQLISPNDDRITLVYTAGYGLPPSRIKTAILQQTFFLYENRGENPLIYRGVETDITMSPQAKATLQRLRRVW